MNKVSSLGAIIFFIHFFTTVSAQHVKIQTWYDDKKHQIKETYFVLKKNNSVLDSLYISYYQNGNIKAKGLYSKNKAFGEWEYYYENGSIRSKGMMKDNIPVGIWSHYYEIGGVSSEGEVVKGLKEGEWKYYYENGNVKTIGSYVKGKKEGMWRYFSEDGSFKAQAEFQNDKGKYTEVYSNGNTKSEGEIVGGKSNGRWKYYYENGILKAEGEEKDGLKEGNWKFYYPNGELASEGNYLKGKEEGKWKYYHENGKISAEGENKEGQRDGYWKLYYKSGSFKAEGNFKQGDGQYKEYYESGKLKVEGNVKKGKNEGDWRYYYENGKLEGKAFYNMGEGNYVGYYENGNLKMEGRIEDGNKVGIWKLYKEDGTLAGYYKTYYENEVPMFKPLETPKDSVRSDTLKSIIEKPQVVLPKKKLRNYTKKVNEYQDFILAAQPLGLFKNQFPVSLEYYIQERLGYEMNFTIYRNPMFSSVASLPKDAEYTRGFSSYFRQKLYQKDKDYGMYYWAQEVRFTSIDHSVKTSDSTGQYFLQAKERTYELSIIIGDRLLRDARKKGWTIDIYGGVGIGYRDIKRNYQSQPKFDALFLSLKSRHLTVPIRLGISIGYLF